MTDQEKLIEKLQKIHAHSKSAEAIGSEEEAQAFALKLKELLDKHKLGMSDIEWEEHKKEVPIVQTYVSHKKAGLKTSQVRVAWMLDLAREIGSAYSCIILLINKTRDFCYVGEKIDGEQARDVYGYMVKVAENLADKEYVKFFYECHARGDVTQARDFRQGFLFGFVTRLRERFKEQERQLGQGEPGTALMRIKDTITRAKKSLEEDPDVKNVRASSMHTPKNVSGIMAGRRKADEVKFGADRINS